LPQAPDYKDFVTDPMDFATLRKRIETGAVTSVDQLARGRCPHGVLCCRVTCRPPPVQVHDLNLIFDNAIAYNGEDSDYSKMAQTLKDTVRALPARGPPRPA